MITESQIRATLDWATEVRRLVSGMLEAIRELEEVAGYIPEPVQSIKMSQVAILNRLRPMLSFLIEAVLGPMEGVGRIRPIDGARVVIEELMATVESQKVTIQKLKEQIYERCSRQKKAQIEDAINEALKASDRLQAADAAHLEVQPCTAAK